MPISTINSNNARNSRCVNSRCISNSRDTSNIRNDISSDKDDHSMETPVTSLDHWIPQTEGTKTEALAIVGTLTKTGNVVEGSPETG